MRESDECGCTQCAGGGVPPWVLQLLPATAPPAAPAAQAGAAGQYL